MRLTLRTLLAWMDDALPPREVREIGQQVSESPFAQQLTERIRKVTRRRRLTIPPATGPEAVDPNLVASYLDNELDADQLAAYEKQCLTSDLHLAEVASAHQILSMLKHKAKVPSEARYRMYRLVKGREAVRPTDRQAAMAPAAGSHGTNEPPWAPVPRPQTSFLEQYGPLLAALGLIGVMVWIGWLNLKEEPAPVSVASADRGAQAGAARDAVEEPRPAPEKGLPQVPPVPVAIEEPREPEPEPVVVEEDMEAPAIEPDQPDDALVVPLPGGVVGKILAGDGLVLQWDDAERAWQRLAVGDELQAGERLVHLAPLRSSLQVGEISLRLVGESEVVLREPQEGESARVELVRGRLVLEPATRKAGAIGAQDPFVLEFRGKELRIEGPPEAPLGYAAYGTRLPGEEAGRMALLIYIPEGKAVISDDPASKSEAVEGPSTLVFDPSKGLAPAVAQESPAWVTDSEPSPEELRDGEAFLSLFGDGTTEFSLLEGVGDPRPEVQRLSVLALGATDNDDLILPLLSRNNAPALRQAACSVLQARLAEQPDALQKLRPLLNQFSETPEVARDLERLLIGFSPEDAASAETYTQLVRDLASPNPTVRELAIVHLQGLTRRDRMGYDPDNPEAGLRAWKDLLATGQLRPVSPPRPETPGGANSPGSPRR